VIKYWLEEKSLDGLRIDAFANLYEDEGNIDEPVKNGPSVDLNV
jgi:1,4-alpha-glucan branching enzyme